MDPALHTPIPPNFEWANSAHTDFKAAHITVLEREVWVAVALPRQRAPVWEACTGGYRRHFSIGRWVKMRSEAEAVRRLAGWVVKYAARIVADVPRQRHRPVAPNSMLDQFKHGRWSVPGRFNDYWVFRSRISPRLDDERLKLVVWTITGYRDCQQDTNGRR